MQSGLQEICCDIGRYLEDADSIFRRKERFDQDRRDFYARTMVLFVLSNRLMDLAREVCLERKYVTSEESVKNKVYFKRLNDKSVISWEMRQEMITLVNFRNQVSHHFPEITREDIEMVYEAIPVYREFIALMEQEHNRTGFEQKRNIIIGAALVTLILIFIWYFS